LAETTPATLKLIVLAVATVGNAGISGGHSFEAFNKAVLYPFIMRALRSGWVANPEAEITAG
jgi:hypothetical protein